jgi:hypothetical protein
MAQPALTLFTLSQPLFFFTMLHHVIRLENPKTGMGPLQTPNLVHALTVKRFSDHLSNEQAKSIPPPIDIDCPEFCLGGNEFVCGVEYISQLYEWFFDFLPEFLAVGFKVYLYTLPKKKILFGASGKQVAFRKADVIETVVLYES